jgi:hypothetical protein
MNKGRSSQRRAVDVREEEERRVEGRELTLMRHLARDRSIRRKARPMTMMTNEAIICGKEQDAE